MGGHTSSTLILNTPQGCVLSPPPLLALHTQPLPIHSTNPIVKFADDTPIVGLITDNNETAYKEEVHHLTEWCSCNNLDLNISKTKELIIDQSTLSTLPSAFIERIESFKFLGMHILADLTWSACTSHQVWNAQHIRLCFHRKLKHANVPHHLLTNFYW